MPYTTLGYTNGLGFRDLGAETNADATYGLPADTRRIDLGYVDTETSGFHQEELVEFLSETHSGEGVTVYGKGPGSHLVSGTSEQNAIFHVMDKTARLERKAERQMNKRSWWQ